MRLGICQIDSQWEDAQATKRRILSLIKDMNVHFDCLVFPEMTLTGFSMNYKKTELNSEDHVFFGDISKSTGSVIIYGGVEDMRNCIFAAEAGNVRNMYSKRHLFTYGGEREVYKPGKDRAVVTICGIRFGLGICYDLRFSYHFWDNASECDAYLLIANWPESRREHWLTLLRARAIENQAYMIGVNRVGSDPKLKYSGDSSVYDPFGELVLECSSHEGILLCDIKSDRTNEIRSNFKFLEDRIK